MINIESYNYWEKIYKRYEGVNSYEGYISRKQAKQRMQEAKEGLPKSKINL